MKFARGLLIFSYGLFTIAAQTLLFRQFLTTFEGNDISVGFFFGSWFLWVGLGALLVYRAGSLAEKVLAHIEFLFLAYLPAFILQLILIIQARELVGIEPYILLPVTTSIFLSIVVNAPVSIITGMLFPIACRWFQQNQQHQQRAVSRVYILEAAGSFLGGLGATALLALGVSSARIFFILALFVSISSFVVQLAKALAHRTPARKQPLATFALFFLLPLCILLCLTVGVDKTLMQKLRVARWSKLFPEEALAGSFQTAQAEYLYGTYNNQWLAVRDGGVCETLPADSAAGRIAAIHLCQNPQAARILVVGSGLGLCRQFLRLPQTEVVTWSHCDNEYIRIVDRFIPPEFKVSDSRFHRLAGDVRPLLAERSGFYDIAILNLPEATSSVLNRYYTLEFYRQIKQSLRPDGILGVRIAGGENIMGTELINLGASTKLTLEKVFGGLVVVAGEDTWFIASDSEKLTGRPGVLRDRFAVIADGRKVFVASGLLSIYLPDRAADAVDSYATADLPEKFLINHDARPLTHLYSLLLAAKQSAAPVTRFVKHLILAGALAFIIPILIFVALRVVYVLKTVPHTEKTSFNSTFLVSGAGLVGIGVVICLCHLYQARFGSLYLHIGVISSVFMAGLTAGAVLISYLLNSKWSIVKPTRSAILLFTVILVHTLILMAIAFWPALAAGPGTGHLLFALAFALCGLCTGSYFPLAADQLAESGFEVGQAGSKLESADHIGSAVGGLLTAAALVPILGTSATLFVFIMLLLSNAPHAALSILKPEKICISSAVSFRLRRLGYVLFGIGVSVILCSNVLTHAGGRLSPVLPQNTAQALVGQAHLQKLSELVGETGREIDYFKVYEFADTNTGETTEEKLVGYVFSSQDLAPEVSGFGGKMNLAVYVDPNGSLINFYIIRSNETGAYLNLLGQWRDTLMGRRLFQPAPFADVDTVTGATVSADAILSSLQVSARSFAGQILGHTLEPQLKGKTSRVAYLPDTNGMYLISAVVLTLVVIYRGGFWSRLAVLCFNVIAGGLVLNAGYSSDQIASLLSLHIPAVGLTGAFLLAVGVPICIILFGNFYCGYICPFGAAQELIGLIVPDRFKRSVSIETMRRARFVKYIVLFVLIIVFFISRNRMTLLADPLIEIFSFPPAGVLSKESLGLWRFSIFDFRSAMPYIVAAALISSLFYTRFWCRYLCPAGAFLSLLNSAVFLKRYLPAKRFSRCQFGLTAEDQMDCLYCDKCRYEQRGTRDQGRGTRQRYLLTVTAALAILVSSVCVSKFLSAKAYFASPTNSVSAGGEPRDVDLQRIRTLIEQKKLSDQEAEFYEKVE